MTRTKDYSFCELGFKIKERNVNLYLISHQSKTNRLKNRLKSKYGYQLSRRKPLPQKPVAEEAKYKTSTTHTSEWVIFD